MVEQVAAAIVVRIGEPCPGRSTASTRWFFARAARIGTTSYAPPSPRGRTAAVTRYQLVELGLALRPANPADARVRCEPGEQRGLCFLEFSV